MISRRILLVGFSVTAEKTGYLEHWERTYGGSDRGISIRKVALGGMQPQHARHVIPGILAMHNFDTVIFEVGTATYRALPESPELVQEQKESLLSYLQLCKELNVGCGVLNLPVRGVGPDNDWYLAADMSVCRQYQVPLTFRAFDDALVTDDVHPNPDGVAAYAEALEELVRKVVVERPDFSQLGAVKRFEAFAVDSIKIDNERFREFSRTGFQAKILEIAANEACTCHLPYPVVVTGLLLLLGPKTGTLTIRSQQATDIIRAYDKFCYYERLAGRSLTRAVTDRLVFEQDANMPIVALRKGEVDRSARVGGVTHILYEHLEATAAPSSDAGI